MDLKKATDAELNDEVARRKGRASTPKQRPVLIFANVKELVEKFVSDVAEKGTNNEAISDMKQFVFEAVVDCMYDSKEFWAWFSKAR